MASPVRTAADAGYVRPRPSVNGHGAIAAVSNVDAVARLEAGLLRKQGRDENAAILNLEGHRDGVLLDRRAACDRQPMLFEQHRVSPSAFAGSAPHC
jgi:hypothetical protein